MGNGSMIGLARVSTSKQDNAAQRAELEAAGCAPIFEEKVSTRKTDRPGLAEAFNYMRAGDTLCVWRIDRLGRSTKDVLSLADALHERGIGVRILSGFLAGDYQPEGEGKFFFTMAAAFAELERHFIGVRTHEGLAAARAQGRIGGRPRVMTPEKVATGRQLLKAGMPPAEVAQVLGVSRASVYRYCQPGADVAVA